MRLREVSLEKYQVEANIYALIFTLIKLNNVNLRTEVNEEWVFGGPSAQCAPKVIEILKRNTYFRR